MAKAVTELRCNLAKPIMDKLVELQKHWGHAYRHESIEHMILESHARYLLRTHWQQQQAHAFRVLKRLKPEVMLSVEEIVGVSFLDGGDRVCIHVALNAQPYQVSRREWEK